MDILKHTNALLQSRRVLLLVHGHLIGGLKPTLFTANQLDGGRSHICNPGMRPVVCNSAMSGYPRRRSGILIWEPLPEQLTQSSLPQGRQWFKDTLRFPVDDTAKTLTTRLARVGPIRMPEWSLGGPPSSG